MKLLKTAMLCAGLGLAGTAAADPVYGPPTPYADGITVYGRPEPYRVPDYVPELSAAVPFDDLDLSSRHGQDELNWRIARTADQLCDRLGEGEEAGRNTAVLPSCQAAARDRARLQVRRAVEDARYAAAYAPPAGYAAPAYPPAVYYAPAPVYAQPVYSPPVYAPPVYYAPGRTAYAPPHCNCTTAWTPPRAGW